MEVGAYHAVKNASCHKQCLEGGLIQVCPGPALVPVSAPGPAADFFPLASAYQTGTAQMPGQNVSGVYQMGAPLKDSLPSVHQRDVLPNGALFSALQTGAPPRESPFAIPQVSLHPSHVAMRWHLCTSLKLCTLAVLAVPNAASLL